jgi:hypothetical protein
MVKEISNIFYKHFYNGKSNFNQKGIALTGIVLFLSLNACRTCNCPAYSEEKSPPTPPKVEKPPPSPPIRESYYAVTETGNEWWMPENTFHN